MTDLVGRTTELRALRARLAAAPVTLVIGRGGIGKTTLVRAATSARAARIEVDARPGDDLRQVLLAIGRGLRASTGAIHLVPTSIGDADVLGEAIVDAAEAAKATVVLDDVHHLAKADVHALVVRTASRARESRWLFVARHVPAALSRGRWRALTLAVGELDRRSLTRIASALAPSANARALRELVSAAQGSPWLLRRCLTSSGDAPPDPREIAAALPARAAPLLRLLAALHLPIDQATVRALAEGPLPRGPEIERRGASVRAHDALRDALAGAQVDANLPARLEEAGRSAGDAAASLEAARLQVASGDANAAATSLARSFDAIVDSGLAPRLHLLLRDATAPALSELRLQAAIVLGAGPALDDVLADPRPQGARARLRHAEALLLAGRPLEARAILEKEPRSHEQRLLLARAAITLGAIPEAESLLEPLRRARDPRVSALVARALSAKGEHAPALALADELGAIAPTLPSAVRREIQHARLGAYSSAGILKQVRAVALSLFGTLTAGTSLIEEQGAIAALSLGEIEGGNLAEGRRYLALLGVHAERAPYLRFFRRMNTVRIHTIEGDFQAAAREAESVLAEARVESSRDHERWGLVARSMLRLLTASDVRAPHAVADEIVRGDDAQAGFLRAFRWMRALRAGVPLAESERPTAIAPSAAIDARIYALLAEATERLLKGDGGDAEASTRRAIALGEEAGYLAHALEARLLLFDILFSTRRAGAARVSARELGERASAIGSRRFGLEAELAEALLGEAPPLPLLERLAALDAVAPAASRRARSLLGLADSGDRVDARVVDATPWHGRVKSARGGVGPSWGVDLEGHTLWLPDGRTKRFAARALHGPIVRALVEAGGECTKEELARAVWGVRDYHPLRDDKRIQVAIMRLRKALGDDGKRPRRIMSTPDGYAVGTEEPARVLGN